MLTYNSFIDNIADNFATLHQQISRFEEGFYDDLAPWATGNEQWPIMWLVPVSVTHLTNSVDQYSIRVYFLDLLEKDESNERDVLSDQGSVARDFTNWLRLNEDNGFNILNLPTAVPVKSVIMDFTAGWYVDMDIEVSTEGSDCTIPFSGGVSPVPPAGCDPVTVNINGDFIGSPASGSIYNIVVENTDEAEVGTIILTGNTTGTVQIGDSTAVNSNATLSVSIVAEGSRTFPDTNIQSTSSNFTDTTPSADPAGYTIADVNWTDSDLTPQTTEYGQAIVCTPCSNPLVSVSVDDDDVVVGTTMSITATTSNFTATSYLFYVNDGNQLTFLAEQASNVYNWTTNVIGSLELYVVATDGTSEVADMINVTVNSNPAFITEWVTWYVKEPANYSVSAANQIQLPLISTGNYDFVVDWGDSTTDTITTWNQAETLHTYASEGQYTVTITGTIEGWQFGGDNGQSFGAASDRAKIINIVNWGTFTITNIGAFYGCIRLDSSAVDAPIIATTDLSNTFRACRSFNGYVGNWDMSGVQKFGGSGGSQLFGMFNDCTVFNNGGVNDMDNWDTSSLDDITGLFRNCVAFNQDLPSWNVSSCTSFASVFDGCTSFNGDVTTWDVSSSTAFVAMFRNCIAFNQDISNWNVSNGQSFFAFMQNCQTFSQDLSGWVLSSATDCRLMFRPNTANSSSLNFDVSGWDMGSATILGGGGQRGMFALCQYFDQSLAGWKIENVTSAQFFLEGVGISTVNYDATLIAFEARLQSLYPGGVGYPNSPFWEFGTSKYTLASAAETARTSLISTFGWTITDGGGI